MRTAIAMILLLLPRRSCPRIGPLFCRHECAVDETLRQVELSPRLQVFGAGAQDLLEDARRHPLLEAQVACRTGRIPSVRNLLPLGAPAHDPKCSVHDRAIGSLRAAYAVGSRLGNGNEGFGSRPIARRLGSLLPHLWCSSYAHLGQLLGIPGFLKAAMAGLFGGYGQGPAAPMGHAIC